ncbi:hypothetical protein NLX83_20235 [Allokutzneria sp. A3M-2-11 16]|uniref:hypothetical protein n=1 Tax=Allokutzneria sp. A3M-2-11 16 TaxID=2962043 RepID=UPI0020B7C3A3|nr:hypothetical protein [Allokutzneria sp. A3M-2-11 16]MCP3801593.1 hypothetical protein [Allokutzneria sp. A3M-2-11 16]
MSTPREDVSEQLDEDRIGVDPLEEGMEPPEHWSGVDQHGTTPNEQREGEPLDERLAEERPDVEPDEVPERPRAATPDSELDETIDDEPPADEEPAPQENPVLVSDNHTDGQVASYGSQAPEERAERVERW